MTVAVSATNAIQSNLFAKKFAEWYTDQGSFELTTKYVSHCVSLPETKSLHKPYNEQSTVLDGEIYCWIRIRERERACFWWSWFCDRNSHKCWANHILT